MNRNVLLIEPNYKNKYPPMGLMKLATYYRLHGDNVRFFKGDLMELALDLICEDLIKHLEIIHPVVFWKKYYPQLKQFLKHGNRSLFEENDSIFVNDTVIDSLNEYRKRFKEQDYFTHPRFDKIGITTLFTFYWDITIETINFAKKMCKKIEDVMVGGIMASIIPDAVEEATGIKPYTGLLNKPGIIDKKDKTIIDELPLDYSILDEIDYTYPTNNAYFAYMTRGCINRCKFCAVPRLEPEYCDYIGIKKQIEATVKRFGEKRDLMLLDNNVLASKKYKSIIKEIIACGFGKNATYIPANEYEITINNLKDSYNDRAYIKKAVKLYKNLMDKIKDPSVKTELYLKLEEEYCLFEYTATKSAILKLDNYIRPLYDKINNNKKTKLKRIIDFNQGIDSRLINPENVDLLSSINISPLRIAFDHWELRDIYEKSIRLSAKKGIKHLSNYLLYNFEDKPEDLYNRIKLNVDLSVELNVSIYSFPMKYHPIDDPEFFKNRDYIGKYWNRKYIRAIQAVLNSTKGKIGKGKSFFEKAFGKDLDEYKKLLVMPETMIMYRFFFDWLSLPKAKKIAKKILGDSSICDYSTSNWWKTYCKCETDLPKSQWNKLLNIIFNNDFKSIKIENYSGLSKKLLSFYVDNRKAKMEEDSDLYKMKVEYEKQPILEAKRKHVLGRLDND